LLIGRSTFSASEFLPSSFLRLTFCLAQQKFDATKREGVTIELKSTVAQQQQAKKVLPAQLQEQAAQIQRVSPQLAAASPSDGALELGELRGRRSLRTNKGA
jgi:hypothetical protein